MGAAKGHRGGYSGRQGHSTAICAWRPGSVKPVSEEDVKQTAWKPIVLPDGRQVWLHIPTLKMSADPPLVFAPTPESEVMVAICSGESCPVCEKCTVVGFEGEHGDEGEYEVSSSEVSELLEIKKKILSCSIATTKNPDTLKTLHELATLRPHPRSAFLSIVVNDCSFSSLPWHVDIKNDGCTDLIGFGHFTGGEVQQKLRDEQLKPNTVTVGSIGQRGRNPHYMRLCCTTFARTEVH
eukprot:4636715-Amphidinium_carterae.2